MSVAEKKMLAGASDHKTSSGSYFVSPTSGMGVDLLPAPVVDHGESCSVQGHVADATVQHRPCRHAVRASRGRDPATEGDLEWEVSEQTLDVADALFVAIASRAGLTRNTRRESILRQFDALMALRDA